MISIDIIDRRFRFSSLDTRCRNDETGAPAFDPRTLLKIILYAYSRGLYSSRAIEEACPTNVTFMALSGCAMPDCTTIAAFVASLGDEVADLFADALAVCLRLGLVGGRILAIDGCKLASNASREWSGTFSDLRKKRDKLKAQVQLVMRSHRQNDRKASRVAKLRHQSASRNFCARMSRVAVSGTMKSRATLRTTKARRSSPHAA
ncbi:MAG: transposase [Leptospirales bacterium]|nr:transposase [Leptospirales bacterium]